MGLIGTLIRLDILPSIGVVMKFKAINQVDAHEN